MGSIPIYLPNFGSNLASQLNSFHMDKIILIGGAPTVGKSFTARHLAKELKLPWISTDTIREWMRAVIKNKENYPYLFEHAFENHPDPTTFLGVKTVEEIIEHQNNESVEVWKGVKSLIATDYVWQSFIIEGIAVIPQLASELMKENKKVKTVFLVDNDEARIRKIIYTRGLWDDARKYTDDVKEKEVAWVLAYNQWLKEETKKFNLPVVEVGSRDSYIKKIKRLVG